MEGPGKFPDILAYHFAEAVRLLEGFSFRVVHTFPSANPGHGSRRVVRQRLVDGGKTLELTTAAEDWGKEV